MSDAPTPTTIDLPAALAVDLTIAWLDAQPAMEAWRKALLGAAKAAGVPDGAQVVPRMDARGRVLGLLWAPAVAVPETKQADPHPCKQCGEMTREFSSWCSQTCAERYHFAPPQKSVRIPDGLASRKPSADEWQCLKCGAIGRKATQQAALCTDCIMAMMADSAAPTATAPPAAGGA